MSLVIDPQTLRALRQAHDWDQQTLARAAAVDPSVVSRLERGLQDDLDASVLVALARSLGVPVDALLAAPTARTVADVVPELAAAVAEVSHLPEAEQRHLAAMLRAYVTSRQEQEQDRL